jgi:hypothetical protein
MRNLSLIFAGILLIGIFLNAPIDMQEIVASGSNNHLKDNPKLFFKLIIGLGVDFDHTAFISKILLIIIFVHVI